MRRNWFIAAIVIGVVAIVVAAIAMRLSDDNGQPTGPERICTALGGPGSAQFLTLEFALPSAAVEGGYAFTVPGSDATLPVVVP